ncbi:hypothetical protein ACBR40_34525 [Nonomuraea sp. AD125B]|uniref:hypothetical protein n=1 Tax=Nonomuraea sp. AD125B TaxID=3242897 RepID=UPI003529A934
MTLTSYAACASGAGQDPSAAHFSVWCPPAAWGHDASIAVAHGNEGVQVISALGGSRTNEDQLRAGAAGEVVGVHRRDDPAILVPSGGRHGVVVAPAARGRDMRRSPNQFMIDVIDLGSHLLCSHVVSAGVR